MNTHFSPPHKKEREKEHSPSVVENDESKYPVEPDSNVTEGGEFMDDALRMEDIPARATEWKIDTQASNRLAIFLHY